MKTPCIYIVTNKANGTLYTGVTSDLAGRIYQHKNRLADGFTKKYNLHKLVYFEVHEDMYTAITLEKQIKAGSRSHKLRLIESINPQWRDLYWDIIG